MTLPGVPIIGGRALGAVAALRRPSAQPRSSVHPNDLKSLRAAFDKVLVRKPESSRDESAEQYLLARGLKRGETP